MRQRHVDGICYLSVILRLGFIPGANLTDKSAGLALYSFYIAAVLIVNMGAGLFCHRKLVSAALLMIYISVAIIISTALITGNFLSRLLIATIPIVDMSARLALHGFYIAALCGMLCVMFAWPACIGRFFRCGNERHRRGEDHT